MRKMLSASMAQLVLAGLGIVAAAPSSRADFILYESATIGGGPGSFNYIAASNSFLGVRFQVPSPVVTTRMGGIFFGGTGDIFGAIVALSSPTDLPDTTNLSSPDVLAHTLIAQGPPNADTSGPISIALTPGSYALVYGGGLFGSPSNALAFVPRISTEVGVPSYIFYTSPNSSWSVGGNSNVRFFIEAQSVPEPSGLVLAGISALGLLAAGWRRCRRRPAGPAATN